MIRKSIQLIGLANKANKLVFGSENVLKAIRANEVYLVLFAKDGGSTQQKKIADKSKYYQVIFDNSLTNQEIQHAIGKQYATVGVADEGFASKIKELLTEE